MQYGIKSRPYLVFITLWSWIRVSYCYALLALNWPATENRRRGLKENSLNFVACYVQDWQTNYHEMELSYVFASPFTGISIDTGAPDPNSLPLATPYTNITRPPTTMKLGQEWGYWRENIMICRHSIRTVDTGAPEGYADVDQNLSRLMMSLWSNFAKYG